MTARLRLPLAYARHAVRPQPTTEGETNGLSFQAGDGRLLNRRRRIVFEVAQQPAGCDPRVATWILPCHQQRQLERVFEAELRQLARSGQGDHVAALDGPFEDRVGTALRGRRCSSPGPRLLASLERRQGDRTSLDSSRRSETIVASARPRRKPLRARALLRLPHRAFVQQGRRPACSKGRKGGIP